MKILLDENPPREVEVPDIPSALVRKFERQAKALARTLEEIRRINPEANGYLQEDSLHLMAGPAHVGPSCSSQQAASLVSVSMGAMDGGAW